MDGRTVVVEEHLALALDQMTKSRLVVGVFFVLLSFPGIINAFHILLYVFVAPDDPYWCSIPALQDAGWTNEQIRQISSPGGTDDSSCTYYENDYEKLAEEDFETAMKDANRTVEHDCKDYEFSNEDTLVREWELVCEWQHTKTSVEMFLSLGRAIGSMVSGWLADRWGRKKSLAFGAVIYMTSAFVATFSPWLSLFIVMRFFVGFGGMGAYNTAFVLLTEICQPKDRQLLGMLFNVPYGVGMLLLPLAAYYVREWRRLHLYLTIPTVLLLIQVWLLPESPKWLTAQRREKKAWNVVKRANRVKRCFCQPPIPIYIENVDQKKEDVPNNLNSGEPPPPKPCCARAMGEFYPVFANSELRVRFFIELFLWTAINMTYFTLSLNSDNFGSDRYVFMAFVGVTELAGYLGATLLLQWMGRTMLQTVLFGITGVCLFVILAVPYENKLAILIIAMVARLCATAVFAVIILHTSELFPVEIRNTAFGLISTVSTIGEIGAPLLVSMIGAIDRKLPSSVCAGSMICSLFVSRVLPETKHIELAYTVEEEMTRKKVSFKNCAQC